MTQLEKRRSFLEKALIFFTLGCIFAYLFVFTVTNITGFAKFCNSDMYADTLVAKRMWEQKTLFPQGWIFGNQYYVIATPVWAALFYGITGNTNTAMILATEVMTILVLVSFFWMLRSFSKNHAANLVCCLLLISSIISPDGPCSENGQLFFLQASYYACYLITLFVVFGDYIRACSSSQKRWGIWTLTVVLSFTTGMQSLRQTVVMVLPIIAFELFQLLRKKLRWEDSWDLKNTNRIFRVCSYTVANVAGAVTAKLLNVQHSTIFGSYPPVNKENPLGWLYAIWDALKGIAGLDFAFHPDYYPIITIFALFLVLIFLCSLFLSAFSPQAQAIRAGNLLAAVHHRYGRRCHVFGRIEHQAASHLFLHLVPAGGPFRSARIG